MNAPTRIFIVDDHQMVIDGLRSLINSDSNGHFTVCGESIRPVDVPEQLASDPPDILLTDISMPGMSGVELTRIIKRRYPDIRILALSMFGDTEVISEMIDAGIDGFILKNTGRQELIEALTKLAGGSKYYTPEITHQLIRSVRDSKEGNSLTDREIEIIRMIESEYSNKQIADLLFISERTVETHRKNIFRKTNTQTVVGLLKYAYERKII
ncbi:MAG TPA: response regulator transcription factor [Mucilaginibacter sp.]|nr:response regulator transcription factor [Mucilaginibacter sp.]